MENQELPIVDKKSQPCAVCKVLMPIWDWLEDRFGLLTIMDNYCKPVYSRNWACIKVLLATIAFAVFVQVLTGFVLWLTYSAGTNSAWESVYFIQHNLTCGWLLRGIHHFSAQVLVALSLVYIVKLLVRGAYKYPREILFWLAILIFFFALGACLTGDLLRWDQNSLAATQVRTKYLLLLPVIGEPLYELALGGTSFGNLTLTRFLALHIGLCGGGLIALLILNGWVFYRMETKGLTAFIAKEAAPDAKKVRYWPGQCVRNAAGGVLFIAVVFALVFHFGNDFQTAQMDPGAHWGAELGSPASIDPMEAFEAARPEWSFRGLYEYTLRLQGVPELVLIFCIPGTICLIYFLMPFIGLSKAGNAFNLLLTFGLLVVAAWLTYSSYQKDWADESYLAAWNQDAKEAARIHELVKSSGGMNPQGAMSMYKADWVLQGEKIFKAQCASCHSKTNAKGEGIVSGTPSAPDLYKYGAKEWVAGWLDSKKLKSDRYFGKTAFAKSGTMIKEIAKMEEDIASEEDEEFNKEMIAAKQLIIDTLAAESALKAPRKLKDGKPEGVSEEFEEAFSETFSCANCHQFYGLFSPKSASVDLTGYASSPWTKAITADPTEDKFYGKSNDRMPSYGKDALLSDKEIDMVSRWIKEK